MYYKCKASCRRATKIQGQVKGINVFSGKGCCSLLLSYVQQEYKGEKGILPFYIQVHNHIFRAYALAVSQMHKNGQSCFYGKFFFFHLKLFPKLITVINK